jgi:UDP-N-acetylmuramyl pentapeptide phosphotransferase/UDP-N-acetylglucosamine-1-phosphate transferase
MGLAGAALVGFLAGRLIWVLVRPALTTPITVRENWRGREVVTAAGIVVPLAVLVVEAGRAVAGAVGAGDADGLSGARALVLIVAVGFGLLGAVDDLLGEGEARGFRGHVAALLGGRLTTGGLKLVGGVAVAVVAVAPLAGESIGRLVADGALVALAANLGNLLDRRPGRAIKVASVTFVALAVATGAAHALGGVAVVIGAGLALLLDDLHERLMLGDAGANVLGAALGLGVVVSCAPGTRLVVLAIVAALNLLSEVVSFSRVIDAIAPLRFLDRSGRLP